MRRFMLIAIAIMVMAGSLIAADYGSVSKLFVEKNYTGVIEQAPAVVATLIRKEKVTIQIYYALSLINTGKIEEGIVELEKIGGYEGVTDKEKGYAKITIANAHRIAKQYGESYSMYKTLEAHENNDVRTRAKEGMAVISRLQKKYAQSITEYEAVVSDSGASTKRKVTAYIWIARMHAKYLKDNDKSMEAYRQIVLVTEKSTSLAEAIKAKDLVGEKELANTLEERKNTEIFDDLTTLLCGKMFNEKGELITKLGTYDTVYVLAKMEKVMGESIYPAELSLVWAKITRLTGIEGVDRFAVEKWLEANK